MGEIVEAVLAQPRVSWETAGSLDGGRAVWCLACLDEPITLPGDQSVEIFLQQPGAPLHDDATAEQLRELITKGAMGSLVIQTDDVRGLYETLKARGVTDVTQEPTEHRYGTDMGVRDPFGNAIRILQQGNVSPEATA